MTIPVTEKHTHNILVLQVFRSSSVKQLLTIMKRITGKHLTPTAGSTSICVCLLMRVHQGILCGCECVHVSLEFAKESSEETGGVWWIPWHTALCQMASRCGRICLSFYLPLSFEHLPDYSPCLSSNRWATARNNNIKWMRMGLCTYRSMYNL